MRHALLMLFTMLSILPVSSSAAVLNVPGDYSSIQAAINAANDGDTVLVADGTYTGTDNRDIDLLGKAITVISSNGPDNCIIDCEDGHYLHRGFHCHNGETHSTMISGFTIINASAESGNGILCDGSSPVISNCIFRDCISDTYTNGNGGALCFINSEAAVNDCIIEGNSVASAGGGLFGKNSMLVITNCTITGNTAKYSGGATFIESDITMTGCSVMNNTAEYTVGGISIDDSTAVFTDCEISGNTVLESIYSSAEADGGGIYISSSHAEIRDCAVCDNTCPDAGGGFFLDSQDEILITGCTIQNNTAMYGGGLYCSFNTLPVISGSAGSSNTFISNFAPMGADLYARNDGDIINAAYNSFDGYHLSDVCVSPQELFDLTGCTSIVPVEQDIYVSPQGDDDNDGLSPLTPLQTIYRAMRMVSATGTNPVTVNLQPGVYSRSETGEHFPIPLADFVTVSGDGPASVTVDAEYGNSVFYGSGDNAVGLSGLTVTGGSNSGLRLLDSSAILNSVHFRSNSCARDDDGDDGGGGICALRSDLRVQFCLIEQNESYGSGGGISFTKSADHLNIRNSIIRDNTWGGISCYTSAEGSVSISECSILNNHSHGVSVDEIFALDTNISVIDCMIQGNGGDGLSLNGKWFVSGCDISLNAGDGFSSSRSKVSSLQNCIIADNNGAGINLNFDFLGKKDCTVTNCSVIRNAAVGVSVFLFIDTETVRFANCIIWGNGGGSFSVINAGIGSVDVTHCCVKGGYWGDGNTSFDPRFTANLDFHVRGDSPCIDAGTDINLPETDLDGNARIQGGGVDIGAYEFSGWPEVPRTHLAMSNPNPGPGDTVSCTVDVWNPGPGPLAGYPLIVILEVFGELYFAPGFSNFDFYSQTFPEGLTPVTVLPDFTWPAGAGTYWGVTWYATLTNQQVTALHGNMDILMFGWHE